MEDAKGAPSENWAKPLKREEAWGKRRMDSWGLEKQQGCSRCLAVNSSNLDLRVIWLQHPSHH